MNVTRIVPNIATQRVDLARAFYTEVLGMKVAMDFGWIITFMSEIATTPQISVASEGGSGTPVPDISIEVDDLDAVYRRATAAGYQAEYGPINEPWGVRRLFLRDPFGKLINILTHD